MKTIKNYLATALVAFMFTATSCVDNEVSPLVDDIRGQQVEWMKAKVAAEAALTAMKTAEIQFQTALTAEKISQTAIAEALAAENLKQQQAINANTNLTNDEKLRALKALNAQNELTNTMTYNAAKAQNDVNFANALTALENAKLNLANATAALATAAANTKNTQATTYYNNYVTNANQVATLTAMQLANTKTIADNNTAITYAGTTGAILIATLNNNKAQMQTQLAAHTAALALLTSTATDAVSIQTQIDNLKKMNTKYQASIDSCTLVMANKDNDISTRFAAMTAASATISTYVGLKSTWMSQQTDSTTKEANILTTTKNIATWTTTVAANNTNVATLLGIYNNAKANSDAKQAAYDALKATSDAAYITYQKADAAYTLANANYNADPSTANQTAKTNAQTARTSALDAYNTANGNTNTANNNLNNALNITNSAKSNYDSAVITAKNNKDMLTNYQNTLVAQQQALADAKTNIKVTRDKIVALTADYNKAVTTTASLNIAYQAALDDKQKTQDVKTAKSTLMTYNNNLINGVLTPALNNSALIQSSIAGMKSNIDADNSSIALIDKNIASAADNGKVALQNINAKLALENAALAIEIANSQKLADYWKGMLTALLA